MAMNEAETKKGDRACFWCANTHNLTTDPCTCACHGVEQVFDSLKAIDPETEWTMPQLYAVKKLLASVDKPAQ